MRVSLILVLIAIAVTLGVPTGASAARPTHRIAISGEVVDNWSITSSESCGLTGGGTMKLMFKTKRSQKVRPFITKRGGKSHKKTMWQLDIAKGGGRAENGWLEAAATVATADNSSVNPNTESPGNPCPEIDKAGCGVGPVAGGTMTTVLAAGYDKRRLIADLQFLGNSFPGFAGIVDHCSIGGLRDWSWPFANDGGVNKYGYLLPKMPSAKSLRKNRVTAVTFTDHIVTLPNPSEASYYTDDVTRTMTVTFTKL